MALLIAGTVSQRYIGLYEAEKLFFAAWWVWIGPLPLPGTYPTLGLLAAGLVARLLADRPWRRAQAGILITHIGALLLLMGGMVTALTAEEGYITLAEGETGNSVSDYHQRELAILKNDEVFYAVPHLQLRESMEIRPDGLPFTLTVRVACRHCEPQFRKEAGAEYKGVAAKVALSPAPLQQENENNQAGLELAVSGADAGQDGVYLLFEPTPHRPEITVGGDVYRIVLRKKQRPLPFTVRLEAFEKFTHPGTDTAREYQSDVTIIEPSGLEWRQSIRMNEPLRTHGHTLYQSSFIDARGEIRSVLAVVKNHGFAFPYIASLVLALGLMLHVRLRARRIEE